MDDILNYRNQIKLANYHKKLDEIETKIVEYREGLIENEIINVDIHEKQEYYKQIKIYYEKKAKIHIKDVIGKCEKIKKYETIINNYEILIAEYNDKSSQNLDNMLMNTRKLFESYDRMFELIHNR